MNPSFIPTISSSSTQLMLVDVVAKGKPAALSVLWHKAESSTRPIETATIEQLRGQLEVLHEAERDRRDGEIPAARRVVGQTLWDVLDGPERRLTRAMAATDAQGDPLDLVIRLRIEGDAGGLADHPASVWRWELLSSSTGGHPTADGRLRVVVQMGDVVPRPTPRVLEHGGLRIVFMAYSPRGVQPLLDYEAEEERILRALERPIEERRARVQVVEDGTLAELERRLTHAPADIVHLTGHGVVTPEGPRLLMEDDLGHRDDISPDDLLRVLKRAAKKPELVVISSCHSAVGRAGFPSFAAALVAGGMPSALGWVQPVRDDVATAAAADLYGRLCRGHTPVQAVAFVREQLLEADRKDPHPSHAWGTLHLLMRDARGFRVETQGTEPLPKTALEGDAHYRYLDVTGGMRVLKEGFIGRRRPLQRLLRVLRTGCDDHGHPLAGAVVLGSKGVGKSCLVGRASERYAQNYESESTVVLHGALDDVTVVEQFSEAARKRRDEVAEAILQRDEPVPQRIRRLLTTHWSDERIVVILDDFEQNLELRDDGDAWPTVQATALLEVLLPACRGNLPKLLVTTTASFRMPPGPERTLAEVALGSFEPPMLHKLWNRMPEEDREKVSLAAWRELGERLGRNARVLDWARRLLRGRTPEEVQEVARKTGEAISQWNDDVGASAERVAELARIYLRTLAMEETRKRLSEDALTFVKRARVYEWPVPREAFEGLTEGLAIDLERDVTVLQNLGMLEVGEMDGQRAHRVSPLVEPDFDLEDAEHWHAVAAGFWEKASERQDPAEQFERTMMAWEHALRGHRDDIAARCGRRLYVVLVTRGLYAANRALAARHLETFPGSDAALLWAGLTEEQTGNLQKGWALYQRGEATALARGVTGAALHRMMREGAEILIKLGRYEEAERRLDVVVDAMQESDDQELYACALASLARVQERRGQFSAAKENLEKAIAIEVEIRGTDEHPNIASFVHELARVLQAQGDPAGARACLERSLDLQVKGYGTDEHPNVAASLHTLAGVLLALDDLAGARTCLERSLAIMAKIHGTEDHPGIAASLHELASVLKAQGDLDGARTCLERSLAIDTKTHGNEEHPEIAASLHELAGVLKAQGDLVGARARIERALAIQLKVHGTEEHPDVGTSLHALAGVLRAQGDFAGARARLERSLAIKVEFQGTDQHPSVAASLHALAGVLQAQGDLAGARARLERSLAIKVKVYGTDEHSDVAVSLHGLAGVLQAQGDFAGARSRLEQTLAILAKVHGTEEHPNVAASLHTLAGVLQAQGDLIGAGIRLERSLVIKVKVYGTEEHPDVAASLHALAGVLRAQDDPIGARTRLERSLAIKVKIHGTEEHPDVAASLHELAGVLQVQGDLVGARTRLERSLAILAKLHGTEEHPDVAACLHTLAGVLRAEGDLVGARTRLESSLAIHAKVYGTEEHPNVAASLHTVAGILKTQGDLPGARARLERALAIQVKVYGTEEHPNVAVSLHELAGVLKAQGDLSGARIHLERALAIQVTVYGTEEHRSVATTLDGMAAVLRAEGKLYQAAATYRRALDIRDHVFGTRDHYMTAETEVDLGMLLVELELHDEARQLLSHAHAVLGAQVPNHPYMDILRQLLGDAPEDRER